MNAHSDITTEPQGARWNGGAKMSIRPTFDNISDWLAAKPAGHFIVERWGSGWAINVHRVGCPLETILAKSPGEVNRLRQTLTDEGLCGYLGKGA